MSEQSAGLPFKTSAVTAANRSREHVLVAVLGMATALLILPLLAIIGLLVVKGFPALSLEFLFSAPAAGMTAGGIFPAIIGTLWLVGAPARGADRVAGICLDQCWRHLGHRIITWPSSTWREFGIVRVVQGQRVRSFLGWGPAFWRHRSRWRS
jgi:hypothetical protein